jgi:hypothetical protein
LLRRSKGLPMSSPVLLDCRDGIALMTLNRPERANVLDLETVAALIAAIDATNRCRRSSAWRSEAGAAKAVPHPFQRRRHRWC